MPIKLYGEGDFVLSDVTSVKVTEDFLGLGQRLTNCQSEENRVDCLTRKYLERVLATCLCVPFSLRSQYSPELKTKTCSSQDLDCVANLSEETEDCLEECEGSIVEVTRLNSVKEENVMESFIKDYQNCKLSQSINLRKENNYQSENYI